MKLKTVILFLAFVVVLAVVYSSLPSDSFSTKNGRFSYPQNRPIPKHDESVVEDVASHSLTKISFESHGVVVYALLRVPKNSSNPPVVIILPGATVPKEARQNLAILLQEKGFASLALDERGNGETKLEETTAQEEFEKFRQGKEPQEARMTLDVLKAFDLLGAFPVNKNKIFLLGESMGGRYSMFASAIEKRFAGVILVSSSGYGLPTGQTQEQTDFLRLIDPDNYVSLIKAPILFIHSPSDKVIPFSSAQNTFRKANEPKDFFVVNCPHGYCDAMNGKIIEWFKRYA